MSDMRRLAALLLLAVGLLAVSATPVACISVPRPSRVPVTLHVMSQCPDAVHCENVFADVLTQVGRITDINTEYIGSPSSDPRYEPHGGVRCMHGGGECQGNIQQLCAHSIYSGFNPNGWFDFVLCQSENIGAIPGNGLECANDLDLNMDAFRNCTEPYGYGGQLLHESVMRTKERGITKSCTVVIDDEIVCVRDGGSWYNCPNGSTVADFVRQICQRYQGPRLPTVCANILDA
ncbi:hypothetical protein H696_00631 [Fonticula alba]|uniref:Gamma-interferon-inducible lysosomal thiol reductase n=1 Tax=Fonticula alba TaxID=691883 RepID=A0A058ZGJ3_FONAL|nr:hypothetical protein H696_00631 [Fonticula alba]KCV73086.1 hypothetical protein H696_00631 [Fonticula alba]|eukprot:XP_009492787.1 hypothetical protein H696_00631 [Fonticula alba]